MTKKKRKINTLKKLKKGRPSKKTTSKVQPKKRLHLAIKIHSLVTLFAFFSYLIAGIIGGPEYLLKDFHDKYSAIASTTNLSVRIIGPPGKPLVNSTPGCSNTDPYVQLDWDATQDTDNYDIYRNGNLLISGLTATSYLDSAVQKETAYDYYVIANGSVGQTQSDTTFASTAKCLAMPIEQIMTIDGINLPTYNGRVQIENQLPAFTGTTNIPNAIIDILVGSGPTIAGNTIANINGYWSWTTPIALEYGTHTIQTTATDPLDNSRFAQDSVDFDIVEKISSKKDTGDGDNDNKKESKNSVSLSQPLTTPTTSVPIKKPSDTFFPESKGPIVPVSTPDMHLSVNIQNENKIAYQEKLLYLTVSFSGQDTKNISSEIPLKFQIINSKGEIVQTIEEKKMITKDVSFDFSIPMGHLEPGKYKLRILATIEKNDLFLSADDSFTLKESPIFTFAGSYITYTDIVSYLGWIFLFLLFILLLFSLLMLMELYLTKQALFTVSEDDFPRGGFTT